MYIINFIWLAERLLFYCFDLIYKRGPEKARKNVRKIEVPTDTPTEFVLGDTAGDMQ